MKVDELSVSRELDALIAEKVLGLQPPEGFERERNEWVKHHSEDTSGTGKSWLEWDEHWPPPYSSNISAAWEVTNALRQRFDYFSLDWVDGEGDCWDCWLNIDKLDNLITASANTAPLAICRAALMAVGVGEV